MTGPRPPRLLAWLVARLVPRGLRDPVLGDLDESYAWRYASAGRWAALRHYVREAIGAVGQLAALSDEPTALTPARGPLDGLGADLRFALRLHARRPASTLLVLLTLGLGIGASTAIFSVVEPALLEPLPYPHGDRLVRLAERDRGLEGWMGFTTLSDLAREARTLDAVAAVRAWAPNLLGAGEPVGLRGQRVSHTFFGMLGVAPALGRDFLPADDAPGAPPVAIVSAALWRDRLAADPAALDRPISLDGAVYTLVGVLPDDFESVLQPATAIWTPLRYDASLPQACRSCRHLVGLARVAPGVGLGAARDEVGALVARMAAASRDDYGDGGMLVEPLKASLIGGSRAVLALLFTAVGLLLAVVCVNVAHLLLGRALERRREFAVRMAVGSGRARLVRQVLLESLLLGVAGSVVAVGLTRLVLGAIRAAAAGLPRAGAIAVDWGVIRFGILVGVATGIAFGLLPALASLRSASEGLAAALRGSRHGGVRRAMVVAEVALAAVLVVAAGLLSRSMGRLLAVDPGFRAASVVTAEVKATGPAFATDSATWRYFGDLLAAVRAMPGVTAAGLTSELPFGGGADQYGVAAEARLAVDPDAWVSAHRLAVAPGYFETMGIPVVEGRAFDASDRAGAGAAAVVNQRYASLTFPGRSPVGERIRIGGGEPVVWRTIVGVVGDVRHEGLARPVSPQVYLPFDQWLGADNPMSVVARASGSAAALAPALHRTIRALHPDPTIAGVETMDAVLARALSRRTIVLRLFQAFGLLALGLAAIGGYGVMASEVAERRRELGIRAALGASAASLGRSVIGETLALGAAGLAVGIPVAAALAIRYGTGPAGLEPADLAVYVAAAAALLLAMLAAGWGPARRAARHDPAQTLRTE